LQETPGPRRRTIGVYLARVIPLAGFELCQFSRIAPGNATIPLMPRPSSTISLRTCSADGIAIKRPLAFPYLASPRLPGPAACCLLLSRRRPSPSHALNASERPSGSEGVHRHAFGRLRCAPIEMSDAEPAQASRRTAGACPNQTKCAKSTGGIACARLAR